MAAFFEAALITNEVYVEIRLLKKQGKSLRQIADEVGYSVNTVRRHLALDALPKYERKVKRATKLSPYEGYLAQRQASAHPLTIPATVLYREIAAQGYVGGDESVACVHAQLTPQNRTMSR